MKIYTYKELTEEFKALCTLLQLHWDALLSNYAEEHVGESSGSCVIGNGFYIDYKPKGCRYARSLRISDGGGAGTGEIPAIATKDSVLEYAKELGIECYYREGRMD